MLPAGAADPDAMRTALGKLGEPTGDVFASTSYRRRVLGVLVDRCLRAHAAQTSGRSTNADDDPPQTDACRGDIAGADGRPVAAPSDAAAGDDTADDSIDIALRLNGEPFPISAPPSEMLVDTIRTRAGLGGTRVGCDQAVCGACTVLMDGTPTASCSTFAWQTDGREVLTIESSRMGVTADPATGDPVIGAAATLPVVQRAFAELSAFQCGYCTPGLILTASALLARHRDPDRTTICDWLDSNICRCTGYLMVIEAVEAAAAALRLESGPAPDGTP